MGRDNRTLLEKGIDKLRKEQEFHCNTSFFGKLSKPQGTVIKDDNNNDYVVTEINGYYELLPGRFNHERS